MLELLDELLLLELEDRLDELLEDRLDELLLDRLLLELAELLDELLLPEFAELLLELLDDPLLLLLEELLLLLLEELLLLLLLEPFDERPPPLRGPLTSERLLLELDELPPLCAPRSSCSPTAAAAERMPRSQPLKKRCTGVSPRGRLSSLAWSRGAALRSTLGNWRNQSRSEGMACACTLVPVSRAATVAAMTRRGCFMMDSMG